MPFFILIFCEYPFASPLREKTDCEKNTRIEKYKEFKEFKKRILVATNIIARGIDIERVNVVFNYDMPEDSDTYLHRVSFLIFCIF